MLKTVTPEHAVGCHVYVDGYRVLLSGNHLRVVSLHQVNAPDLVSVREHQVRAFSYIKRIEKHTTDKTMTQFSSML